MQDDAQEMAEAVTELLSEILVRNEVSLEELVSIFLPLLLTCTAHFQPLRRVELDWLMSR